ncbi:MAG: radical SAM protein [Alphaproteobacteria bacterium]
MHKKIKYLLHAFWYLFKIKILRKEIPFIGGIIISEKCNLKCKHCSVANKEICLTFKDIENGLKIIYDKGVRSVFISGGEPFLWEDGKYKLEDVTKLAYEIGFYLISIYTNGTFPLRTSCDAIFVSMDGLKETTNKLRGNKTNIYDRIIKNIKESKHPNIIINYTINSKSQADIENFCEEIKKNNQIKGIFFYFHTPYYGFDELFLNLDEKRKIIRRIISLKRSGNKIFNSYAALKGVYKDNWSRPSSACCVYANNKLYKCCRAIGNDDACKNCGYLGYPEIIYILKLRPSSIISALSFLKKCP